MNTYPLELLAQLGPVMFVAGLNHPPTPSQPASTTSGPQPPAPTHHSRSLSSTNNDPNLPTSHSQSSISSSMPASTSNRPDPFTVLLARLREMFLNQRKITVWDPVAIGDNDNPEKKKIFQVVLVDKDVRFPPRKVTLESTSPEAATGHSPLSPLTLTSPLHPDGLIAPIWIRKHTMLVPAVFVLFTRLFELDSTNTPGSPPDALELERQHDTQLSSYVAARKRLTNERGIKLTVVLLASRRMLDDPSLNLDARLTFIRRQSGLDSRAALFVLSPIGKEELGEFVKSLQAALWDPAVEYYTAHSKRVRQKRNRHQAQSAQSQAQSHYNHPSLSHNGPAPLSPKGWTVRYEYKMACFAEFRGEHEVALKHYQDAYAALTMLFLAPGSSLAASAVSTTNANASFNEPRSTTATPSATAFNLPPRTKRWAEAKVLADTINVKIIKLYLYNNETGLALAQQRLHVRTFPTVAGFVGSPTGEGKEVKDGEEGSYEYWSWVGRMWSVLAEMLVEGSKGGSLIIPIHKLKLPPPNSTAISGRKTTLPDLGGPGGGLAGLGINPSHALMHPGWYYFLAAECAERKVARFIQGASASAKNGDVTEQQKKTYVENVRNLIGDVLELYTKSYELFKAYSSISSSNPPTLSSSISNPLSTAISTSTSTASNVSNPPTNDSSPPTGGSGNNGGGRLPLYIAHRIALTYARFPDPNPFPPAVEQLDGDDEGSQFAEWWNEDESGDVIEIDEVKGYRGKDPEKLALASRFMERIAKSYQREGVIASGSASSMTFSSSSSSSASFPFPPPMPAPKQKSGFASEGGLEWDRDSWGWGWYPLLTPLLRTWSDILKVLVGREVREWWSLRSTLRTKDADSDSEPGQKKEETLEMVKGLEKILEDHLESYIRVLVERISVESESDFSDSYTVSTVSKRSGESLQTELNRALRLWNRLHTFAINVSDAEDAGEAEKEGETEKKLIRIDHTETQPIFDTSVVFWREKVWISESTSFSSSSASSAKIFDESTPFQIALISPSRVAIDELQWSELRVGVVFEYESYEEQEQGMHEDEGDSSSFSGDGNDAATVGDEEKELQEESKPKIAEKMIMFVIRHSDSGGGEGADKDDPVRTVDVGYVDFGSDFTEGREVERHVDASVHWTAGQRMIIMGSVGVSGGLGIGHGRVRVSSLLLRLNAPIASGSDSSPSSPIAILEIPLNIPARRGMPLPLPVFIRNDLSSLSLTSSSSAPTTSGGGKGQLYPQAWWFAGFVESKDGMEVGKEMRIKTPRWAPVSRRNDEAGKFECVEIKHRPHPVSISVHHFGPAYVGEEYPVEVVVKGCGCRPDAKEEEVEVVLDVLLQPVESDVAAINTISIGEHQSNTMIKGILLGSLNLHTNSTSSTITRTIWIKNTGGAGDRVVDMGVRTRPKTSKSLPVNRHLETETLKTVSIPCIEPMSISYDVAYRRRTPSAISEQNPGKPWWLLEGPKEPTSSDVDEGSNLVPIEDDDSNWVERVQADTETIVRTTIGCIGPSGVEVEKIVLKRRKGDYETMRILSSEMDLEDENFDGMFPLEFLPGDQISDVCRIGIANRDDDDEELGDTGIPSAGDYEVSWRRILPSSEHGPLSITHFSLPVLHPPIDGLIALLDVPPVARLHEPIPLTLTIRNRHPTRTADVYVQLDITTAAPGAAATSDSTAGTGSTIGAGVINSTPDLPASSSALQGFIVAGLRGGRVPLLLAGAEERLVWMLIPVECGYVTLPKISVIDRRKGARGTTAGVLSGVGSGRNSTEPGGVAEAEDAIYSEAEERGKEVNIIDVRTEQRKTREQDGEGNGVTVTEEETRFGTVLVLP